MEHPTPAETLMETYRSPLGFLLIRTTNPDLKAPLSPPPFEFHFAAEKEIKIHAMCLRNNVRHRFKGGLLGARSMKKSSPEPN
jgi:hypothetical protein